MRLYLTLALLALSASSALANDHFILVSARDIFVPSGYSSDDEVVVVAYISMTDDCIEFHHTEVIYDAPAETFFLKQFTSPTNRVCLPTIQTFSRDISLGTLPPGTFTVRDWGGAEAVLEVAEAADSGPGHRLYAPVETIDVRHDAESGVTSFILEGRFTNTCTRMEAVEVTDSGRTKEIFPFQGSAGDEGCEDPEVPFSWYGTLPQQQPGRYLAHVRTASGKPLNLVFEIP